ncbi:MFP1 attachment factor 1-like [Magnolia sinica]|uniref:MFP1 attachment factor 1-like n=1 Tax=Magnolia sinica TaxID=86752 RepID=UPI00265953C3|nr:MFP1 attachment factor 1-like [Magnolia sinica]
MAAEEPQQHPITEEKKMNVSLSIWPPTQRTRDAVTNRLIETLSSPSVLSKRYGSMPPEEASSAARVIEEEAFSAAASLSNNAAAEDDGIEILQIYSKEISKRMLEAVKARAPSASPAENLQTQPPAVASSEEISSVGSESSQT